MKIGLFLALDQEYEAVQALFAGRCEGKIAGNDIFLVHTGIGKVNAAVNAALLIKENRPDCIVSGGCAGALQPGVDVLDLAVASEVVYHDAWCGGAWGQVQGLPERYAADEALLAAARSLSKDPSLKVHEGLMCSGDRFVDHSDAPAILGHFPEALAVDMESGALAQTCHLFGTPFISLRVISDNVSSDASHYDQYLNFWDTVGKTSFEVIRKYLYTL